MINRKPRDKRPRHRCPECHSANIYKRFWVSKWTKNSRRRGKYVVNPGEPYDKLTKYRCIVCKNEFDIALVE